VETIRTTITIETEEVWIIKRRRRFVVQSFCRQCNRQVSMIPPEEAALLLCYDINTIYSFIEGNHFHVLYFNDEKPLICLKSLCSV
jgi:hypothetical protein